MDTKRSEQLYSYEIRREAGEDVLYINYLGAPYVPSIASSPEVMERTIDALIENPNASRVVFMQQRNYNYDFKETSMLLEIAQLYVFLLKQERVLSIEKLSSQYTEFFSKRYNEVFNFMILLKRDPVAAYTEIRKIIIESKILLEKIDEQFRQDQKNYIAFLEKIFGLIKNTLVMQSALPYLDDYRQMDRAVYERIFRPDVIPNFTFTRLIAELPEDAEIIDQYKISNGEFDESIVTILKKEDEAKLIYHLSPPENSLTEEQHMLLNLARQVLTEHQPKAEEFTDTDRIRQVFFNISQGLLSDLANSKDITLNYSDLNKLATILVRHTIGFGLIEVLLQDKKLQDIVLNAPIPLVNIFVRHETYDECSTNILPSQEDADSWAAKFRMISGRPLDEANPILDTQLAIGNVRARIAIVQEPLSPNGLTYALRRHREEPWTLPLFVKNRMINSFTAGLFSFLIDGSRTLLIAGTRSSGKTSLLGSLMLEIIPKYRIITIEDSVTGDSSIIIKENGKFKKTTISDFIDEQIKKNGFLDEDGREKALNADDIKIFSVDKSGKVLLSKPSKFIKHKTNKQIYEINTTSGKRIKVTEDHSLFSLDEKNILKPIKSKELKEGNFIAIPSLLPFDNSLDKINILDNIEKFGKKVFVIGEGVNNFLIEYRKELFEYALKSGFKKPTIQSWTRNKIIPIRIFEKFRELIKDGNLKIKCYGNSREIDSQLKLDESFLNFIGLWIADGCYDKNSIIISVQEEENKKIVRQIAERFNIPVKLHHDKFSSMLNSSILKEVMTNILGLKGNAYTKKIPSWMHNLSNKQAGWLLKGYFSGDGCASDKEVIIASCSRQLVEDISTLLLRFNIILRISKMKDKDKTINCRIGSIKMLNSFKDNIGFLVNSKQNNLEKLCSRISTHDTSDVIPLSLEIKNELSDILGEKFSKQDYITRENNLGREHLKKLLEEVPEGITNPIDPLRTLVGSDIFWDRVKSIKKVSYEGYVYDISVPECENFICENILAHNTLELPVESLRKLKYDILRLKVRSALLETTTEVSADEGIRTSLRLGDSCLIIGEVRSIEAKALYEAMRVGALANVVAGTIHGASPYGVFDRVVNDLNVPATSFKATDIIAVANPIKTPDGLHSWKRLVQLSEVRKHWTKDPQEEKGFVDLLKYNVEKDELVPSDDLINGDSEVIKDIAGNVKGWAGNWDAVYDNIILRGKIKQEIVDVAEQLKKPEILEAEFNSLSNNAFHKISDKIRQEIGLPLSKRVFPEWQKWLNQKIRGKIV
ncbi:MAG: Flp pilus assembly complex ATPase component TadA [Nanoarchaeota archaeon]|nr:Flp pilus assembly complex ATPase component TadA [Nanoarchaeota archaeon]